MPVDPSNLVEMILASVPCLVMAALFLGIVALFLVGIFLFVKRSRAISNKVAFDLNQTREAYFAEVTPQLLPWETKALADLSTYMEYSSHRRIGSIHARGKIKSIRQPEAPGWLAFDLSIDHFAGTMVVKSSERDWELEFPGMTAKEVPVMAGGELLGTIQQAGKEVQLLSPDSQPIGCYHQHQLLGGIGGLTRFAQTPYFGPVELEGRSIAEINRNPILLKPIVGKVSPPPPLARNLDPFLTAEEEKWLVALVGWEILYRIVIH